jgi:cytoskeleton protein RodZ
VTEPAAQQPSASPADAVSSDAQQRAGAALRLAREAAGRSSAELATQLKVARDKIDALEAGDWVPLHNASYARALLRAAAKALHADADAIVGLLPPMIGALPAAVTMVPSAVSSRPRRPWLIATLLLLAAAAVIVLIPRRQPRHEAPASARAPLATTPRTLPPAEPKVASAVVPRVASGVALPAEPARPLAGTPRASVPAPLGLPSASASSPLLLQADAPSWVEVRDAQGHTVFQGTVAAGGSRSLQVGAAQLPLRLTVGNAAHTRVVFRERPVPIASAPGNVVHLNLP